jgi:FMN-dependent NADH-azoreductase
MTGYLLTYEGYQLMERAQGGYRSIIGKEMLTFDTAAQWKKYIDKIKGNGKSTKRNYPY